ncbi:glycosyltransferase family 2 protein [Massilia suwonensis]|uniref:Glycosyltransferase family 2 protein n=1 Tax=Massilia suwonensis TaxID=648895 RepID=A0ABW0MPF0_9BURK
MPLSFSIVINTLNRATLLAKTLDSLRWLKYRGRFEVIVVNGPSTDHSQDVIDAWLPAIRAARCEVANLSVSRNIGICMARGDIVAFIDDDAIPEPEWLEQLAQAYDDPAVGAAGGLVFDQTGYAYQYEYSSATRLANANWRLTRPADHLAYPGAFEFPYLQGTNTSFRRSALLEVGGFDEEIEYYLDETELCCRLVDAGYLIRQLPNAYVHHKFAPSNIRNEHKITRYRYPVIKNRLYFGLKHGRAYVPLADILADNRRFAEEQWQEVESHIAAGRLPASERAALAGQVKSAWERAMARGLSGTREYITPDKQRAWPGAFLAFDKVIDAVAPKALVLVARRLSPADETLARSLAAQGHIVCLITESPDCDRVDFEDGVWMHRITAPASVRPAEAIETGVAQDAWNWSASVRTELQRIAPHRRIDAVQASPGAADTVAWPDGEWPLVSSIDTTLHTE